MAYQINKTSGALLVNLADGQIDVDLTDITLIGKNYSGFGEAINENFVKMLENFANASVCKSFSWTNLVGHSIQIESIYRYCLTYWWRTSRER